MGATGEVENPTVKQQPQAEASKDNEQHLATKKPVISMRRTQKLAEFIIHSPYPQENLHFFRYFHIH